MRRTSHANRVSNSRKLPQWRAGVVGLLIGSLACAVEADGGGPLTLRPDHRSLVVVQGDSKKPGTFSPLHDLLGIDPDTGQFKPPKPTRADPDSVESDTDNASPSRATPTEADRNESRGQASEPRDQAKEKGVADSPGFRDPLADDAIRTAEDARQAVKKLSDRIQGGSVEDLSTILGEQFPNNRLVRFQRQLVLITAAVLMIYPLGILLSEAAGWWLRYDEPGTTELDRRYHRGRLRQRLTLAAVLMLLIGLLSVGSVRNYWWGEPNRFTMFCVVAIALALVASFLAAALKRAAKEHELAVMREMRRHLLEMRQELEELRKRMRRVTISGE